MITRAFHLNTSLPNRLNALRFRHLQLLEYIHQLGSVRQAADHLYITQPAASAMLKEIEAALGVCLFTRSHRGMSATPALLNVLRRAGIIRRELQAIAADTTQQAKQPRDMLRLGVLPRSMHNVMPAVLTQILQQHQHIGFILSEATSDVLLRGLVNNHYDCILGRFTREAATERWPQSQFHIETVYEEGMHVVCSHNHPLKHHTTVNLDDLLGWDWVLPPPGSVTRNLLIDEFLHAGLLPPEPVIVSANFLSNLNLVEAGRLLTIAPSLAAEKYARMHPVHIVAITLHIPLPPISLMWRKDRKMEGALDILRQALPHDTQNIDNKH